jgi:Lamin Tail Domain
MNVFNRVIWCVLAAGAVPVSAQISSFPYTESFDGVTAPALPRSWTSSEGGFVTYASSPRSSPNCVSSTGNRTLKVLTSPVFDFLNHIPDKLTFWERRTSTAAAYRLQLCVSTDGVNFGRILAEYDTIASTTSYVQHVVNLASARLQYQSSVQFRWQVLGDNTNSTGVFRMDDIVITTATANDLALLHFSAAPTVPTRNDSISLNVVVKNLAVAAAKNYSVNFFIDGNNHAVAESNEQFASVAGLPLAAGDSAIVTAIHSPLRAGIYRCIAIVSLPQDENHANDTTACVMTVGNVKGDVLVNEIMYAPTGDEPEWVEFYNASSDTVDLRNWKISDSNISTKSIITSSDYFLPPMKYAIVAKSTDFQSVHPNVPAIIASFSALNNTTADDVVLYDAIGTTIDSVMYAPAWGGQNGKSLERIDWQAASTLVGNWGTSVDSSGSTPGSTNSIARMDYDLALTNIMQTHSVIDGKIIPVITATLRNAGRMAMDTMMICFYADSNHNARPDSIELLCSKTVIQHLAPLDFIVVSESLPQISPGNTNVIIRIQSFMDERARNDTASISISIEYEKRALVINEIMFNPLEGQNEWFEVFNPGSQSVDLYHWTVNDRPTFSGAVNKFVIADSSVFVFPQHYAVIAADSSIIKLFPDVANAGTSNLLLILKRSGGLSFNDDGDVVQLNDLTGKTIDSVAYLSAWQNPAVADTKGRSLERINPLLDSNDPHNWSTCTSLLGGTPGKANSILTNPVPGTATISVSPNPFSPDGDGFEDFCMISFHVPFSSAFVNVRLYDIKGRLIRTLVNTEFSGSNGSFIWNGLDDNGQRVRIGVYVVYFDASEPLSHQTVTAKKVAVVAAKL